MVDWDERYRRGWAYGKQPNAFLPMDKAKEHKCTTKPDAENAKTK